MPDSLSHCFGRLGFGVRQVDLVQRGRQHNQPGATLRNAEPGAGDNAIRDFIPRIGQLALKRFVNGLSHELGHILHGDDLWTTLENDSQKLIDQIPSLIHLIRLHLHRVARERLTRRAADQHAIFRIVKIWGNICIRDLSNIRFKKSCLTVFLICEPARTIDVQPRADRDARLLQPVGQAANATKHIEHSCIGSMVRFAHTTTSVQKDAQIRGNNHLPLPRRV